MSKAHIGSQLPLTKFVIPIDYDNTVQLNHFDVATEDINGIQPIDDTTTLLRSEGKYGGCVAISRQTINRMDLTQDWYIHPAVSSDWAVEKLDNYTYKFTALVNSPSLDTYNNIASHPTLYSTPAFQTVTYSCEVIDRSTTDIYPSTGGWGTIEWNIAYGKRTARTITHDSGWFHGFNIRVSNPTGIVAGDFLTVSRFQLEDGYASPFVDGERLVGKLVFENTLNGTGTINFWAKYPKYSTAGQPPFISTWISYSGMNLPIGIDSSYLLQGFNTVDATLYEDAWHMYTITAEAELVTTYIDAQPVGSYYDSFIMMGDTVSIGAEPDGQYVEDLWVDELRIDKVARTQEEIRAWYMCNAPFYPRGLTCVAL